MKKILFFALILIGFNAQAQRLIVRMDDIGGSHSANMAILKCYKEGIGTSTEVLAPAPWFLEAARILNENPGLDVGVHLCLTSEWAEYKWRPLTHCPSICDEDGYLLSQVKRDGSYNLAEVEAELRAQIELSLKYIKNVTHLTDHMVFVHMDGISQIVDKLCKEYGLVYQGGKQDKEYGLMSLPMSWDRNKTRAERLLDGLQKAEKGKTYWTIEHPGIDNDEMDNVYARPGEDVGKDRQDVTNAFTDPTLMKYIKDNGIELISFGQFYKEHSNK